MAVGNEAPRTTAPGGSGRAVPTDTVLTGYAALLRSYRAASGRIYVIGGGGLDLGFPILKPKEAAELVSDALKHRGEAPKSPPNTAMNSSGTFGTAHSEKAGRFLADELERFQSVIDAWDAYSSGSAGSEDVTEALRMLDHVYCDFPDPPPLPRNDDSFLVRAVTRCRELRRYILRITEG